MVSDQTLEGLGTTSSFLIQALFGSLVRLAGPGQQLYPPTSPSDRSPPSAPQSGFWAESSPLSQPDVSEVQPETMAAHIASHPLDNHEQLTTDHLEYSTSPIATLTQDVQNDFEDTQATHQARQAHQDFREMAKPKLTDLLPEPGYFLAGAVSGAVSRTATAPLDRLKVALLVRTGSSSPVEALKPGQKAARPITDAVMTLWRAGGFRTFFAGTVRVLAVDLRNSE